jgi:hypothetical protein
MKKRKQVLREYICCPEKTVYPSDTRGGSEVCEASESWGVCRESVSCSIDGVTIIPEFLRPIRISRRIRASSLAISLQSCQLCCLAVTWSDTHRAVEEA